MATFTISFAFIRIYLFTVGPFSVLLYRYYVIEYCYVFLLTKHFLVIYEKEIRLKQVKLKY